MARSIEEWARADRPRERLDERGAEALSELELLALVLGTGGRGESALDRAAAVLETFRGLKGAARASTRELLLVRGLGPAKAAAVAAAFELGRRAFSPARENGSVFRSSADVFAHFRGRLGLLRKEVFCVLLLDAKHRKLREVQVSEGTLTASLVHPREVFAPAIRESAAAILLVHNHPSGDPTPSVEDVQITRRLREVGDLVGVRVLDHVIVGDGAHYSFADGGSW
ncbi:MAG: repair protein RadC [Candidatus Binatota bacterium]|nr:repair protein RadC [Candidatus Binatota bacterium]